MPNPTTDDNAIIPLPYLRYLYTIIHNNIHATLETIARIPGCPHPIFIVSFGSSSLNQEGHTMFGPGEYRADPSEGITTPAELPLPELIRYHRSDTRHPCPRCGHLAYRDKQHH